MACRIEVIQGDITTLAVDAIVNAANPSLMGGGGVDGAIHRAGGPAILEECCRIRAEQYPQGLPTGEAVLTTGGRLPARYVIHTVGPVWHGGDRGEPELLARAYRSCLRLADQHGLESIAFPSISTGVYGFPKEPAARIALREIRSFLEGETSLHTIVLACFDPQTRRIYEELLASD